MRRAAAVMRHRGHQGLEAPQDDGRRYSPAGPSPGQSHRQGTAWLLAGLQKPRETAQHGPLPRSRPGAKEQVATRGLCQRGRTVSLRAAACTGRGGAGVLVCHVTFLSRGGRSTLSVGAGSAWLWWPQVTTASRGARVSPASAARPSSRAPSCPGGGQRRSSPPVLHGHDSC